MENVINFIKSEKIANDDNISKVKEKLNTFSYEIEEIDKMITELSKNIDTTYEIFSPNAFDKDNNIVEIEKLSLKKNRIKEEIVVFNTNLKQLENDKVKIDNVLDETYKLEEQLSNSITNTKYLIDKEINKKQIEYVDEITDILEMQIYKETNNIEDELKHKIETYISKMELCENLIDIDSNRTKIELNNLKEDFNLMKKNLNSKMFHVKHSDEKKLDIYLCVKNFIKEYQKNFKTKIEFSFSGTKANDKNSNVINIIRIVKEAIDNSLKHSKCTIINVNVVIDKLNELENNQLLSNEANNTHNSQSNSINEEITNDKNSKEELHQINFTVNGESSYTVNVIVTDNGEGFILQNEQVLIQNNLYGIALMKKRANIIGGKLFIEANSGIGTTIKLIYNI